jgi:hypothetical protein
MVAKIASGKNIRGILNYNENKVKESKAECIIANRFTLNLDELTFNLKYNWFKLWINQNQKVKTNAVHISLNFDPSDKVDKEKLKVIATSYMEKIGFGNQPFLVYQHFDAAHPHVHIVTTNISEHAERIDLHNIGRNQSEKARKEIESEFQLVKAEGRKQSQGELLRAITLDKASYGKSETKRAISNVVRQISKHYKYTSLAEFNAALKCFNVLADRGHETTRMFARRGLVYSIINDRGEKVGVPIKASSIYGKPTLDFIEKQFALNEKLRRPQLANIKSLIDKTLIEHPDVTTEGFIKLLNKQNVGVLFRSNTEGFTYGVTFVDHSAKTVVNGSDIGKGYGAKAILEKISGNLKEESKTKSPERYSIKPDFKTHLTDKQESQSETLFGQLLADLTKTNPDYSTPNQFIKRKRRRKNKGKRI